MIDSIFNTIKKMLGVHEDDDSYDTEILNGINTAFFPLTQIGIGPESGFCITGEIETWNDFIGEKKDLNSVKTFVYLKTKLAFDPPANSFQIESINRTLDELIWRLDVQPKEENQNG